MNHPDPAPRFSPARARRRPYALPYFEQAKTWYRFLKRLRDKPFHAWCKKEEALARSIRLRGRSFVVPSRLDPPVGPVPGLALLEARLESGERFVELVCTIARVDENDPAADEVHLLIERPEPTRSRNRRLFVGRFPQADAFWMVPLLRLETDAFGTGPVLQVFAGRMDKSGGRRICVVIARAHEAARNWIDWKESRRSYRAPYPPRSW